MMNPQNKSKWAHMGDQTIVYKSLQEGKGDVATIIHWGIGIRFPRIGCMQLQKEGVEGSGLQRAHHMARRPLCQGYWVERAK